MSNEAMNLGLLQLSAVKEMANIGLGHATTAIADLTQKPFYMSVPHAASVGLEEIPLLIGGREEETVGIYMAVSGEVGGHIAFLFPWSSAQFFWKLLIGAAPATSAEVGELEASVMLELGNIINSSFLNAIADMAEVPLHATPPLVSIEMAAAILQSIVLEACDTDHVALSIETRIYDDSGEAEGFFLFIPTVGGLQQLFDKLGISEAA
jgi:chemotaxis protein CheC